jgi:peptidoglycan-N-acetylglucosamine deacetylase
MIFEDTSGRRWRGTRRALTGVAVASGLALATVIAGDLTTPPVASADINPHSNLDETVSQPISSVASLATAPKAAAAAGPAPIPFERRFRPRKLEDPSFVHSAFLLQDDELSVQSLKRHLGELQVAFPDWLSFASPTGQIVHRVKPEVAAILKASGVLIMPRLSNTDAAGAWFEKGLTKLFKDTDATDIFIDGLVDNLTAVAADGVNIDIEGLKFEDRIGYVAWLETVISVLHDKGFTVTVDIPMNDGAYDYEAIGKIADLVVLMAYDQSYSTSKPGPVAGQEWFDDGVTEVTKRIAPDKLIIGLGAYGYDWSAGSKEAEAVGFATALERSVRYGAQMTAGGGDINSHFGYTDQAGVKHELWLLDAVSGWNQYHLARELKTRGVALWRTGLEDEGLWSFYRNRGVDEDAFDPETLSSLAPPEMVTYHGTGAMLRVLSAPRPGQRKLSQDGPRIDSASLMSTPKSFEVQRFGQLDEKAIALTFDDGPDPQWTPAILDALARNKAPGTFFVVGDQVQKYPSLVARTFAAGHLIGNHTFNHPDLRKLADWQVARELSSTQRLIETVTGHSTVLFRAPYDTDNEPTAPDQLKPLRQIAKLGYIVASADVDAEDFRGQGSDRIVENILSRLTDARSHVVVMHDGGGNRHATAEAIDKLAPLLRARGYRLVGLDQIMGVLRTTAMPALPMGEKTLLLGSQVRIGASTWGWQLLQTLFALSTGVALFRIMMLGGLIYAGRNREKIVDPAFAPPVRVLVPAYNEAKVIERTLETLMKSDYPNFTVSVIDDGSKDETAEIVRGFAAKEPRVSLITQANAGKSAALNNGFAQATEDYIVTIDADTIIFPHTIRKLMEPFADPKVDAVCGNVQVGNVHNMLTAFQNIEYVTSQNYDRRAFDVLNCISVVPGATGAWRRAKVLDVGGYAHSTLTEDADMTFAMLAAGARITYAPEATSATEAPETLSALFRQRFRWSFGTFQCFWKHRRQLGKGPLGLVAMPNMLMFQFLFPLLAPIGDALLLYCL